MEAELGESSQSPKHTQRTILEVRPSYTSDTAIRIVRTQRTAQKLTHEKNARQSYSAEESDLHVAKRITSTCSESTVETLPCKKVKFDGLKETLNKAERMRKQRLALLAKKNENYFGEGFFKERKQKTNTHYRFPSEEQAAEQPSENQMLKMEIEIVSCENTKMKVKIHDGLLKANTSHSKAEQALQGEIISNPFNQELKAKYCELIPFIKQYKTGYTPIDLQHKNAENNQVYDQTDTKNTNRGHFIRKKQATLSLPRSCGVSYVKPSESSQEAPFDPLPPLIFQASSCCEYNQNCKDKFYNEIHSFIRYTENHWIAFIETEEAHMRTLLLGTKVGSVGWVHGLENLWPLFNEGSFFLLLFTKNQLENETQVWQSLNNCLFKIGILSKKGVSGKKSFFKSIRSEPQIKEEESIRQDNTDTINSSAEGIPEQKKLDGEDKPIKKDECELLLEQLYLKLANNNSLVTLSLKLEMYVKESQWKLYDKDTRNLMNALITSLKEHLEKKSIKVISNRLKLANQQNKDIFLEEFLKRIRRSTEIKFLMDNEISFETELFSSANFNQFLSLKQANNDLLGMFKASQAVDYGQLSKHNQNFWEKSLKMPIYYISTRDSFAFDLIERVSDLQRDGRNYKKIEYFFEADNLPNNFGDYLKMFPNWNVGVVAYHGFFMDQELRHFEQKTMETEKDAFKNKFLQMTVQPTIVGQRVKRTKFFFGYRYMWTQCQLAEPLSYVGAGVRRDVTSRPKWIDQIENPLVEHGIIPPSFINSVAINVYHDGKEGLAQHFDDAVRFKQPIYTIRLVSDGRLSFGSQFYGFCNGAFVIPLPRGCICVMNQNSYAANGVKHCIRPCDMTGKSVAVILRQMHHAVVNEAARYDQLIDLPSWLSTMNAKENAMTFAEQKRRQAEQLIK